MPVKLFDNSSGIDEFAKAIPSAIQGYYDSQDRDMKRKILAAQMLADQEKRERQKAQDILELEKQGYEVPGGSEDPMGLLKKGMLSRREGFVSDQDLKRSQIYANYQGQQAKELEMGLKQKDIALKEKQLEREDKKEMKEEKQMAQAKRSTERDANRVIDDINDAITEMTSSDWASGALAGKTAVIPGTPAYKMEKMLKTIKANVAFDKLKKMREESPTGGALGQVSERELDYLQSVMGDISADTPDDLLKDYLQRLGTVYNAYLQDVGAATREIGGKRNENQANTGGGNPWEDF